jgi:hypothetical protein
MSNVVSPCFEKLIKKNTKINPKINKYYFITPSIPIKHVNYSVINLSVPDNDFEYYNSKKYLFLIDLFS